MSLNSLKLRYADYMRMGQDPKKAKLLKDAESIAQRMLSAYGFDVLKPQKEKPKREK